jgi:hypothetical protein
LLSIVLARCQGTLDFGTRFDLVAEAAMSSSKCSIAQVP